jgi:hypothetical protein
LIGAEKVLGSPRDLTRSSTTAKAEVSLAFAALCPDRQHRFASPVMATPRKYARIKAPKYVPTRVWKASGCNG